MNAKIGIDMLDVGKGDSYVIELYDEKDVKYTIVIDGGTTEKGEMAVSHANAYHGGMIDLAICTHPDTDHIGGLVTLLEKCKVTHLIINDPRSITNEEILINKAQKSLSSEEVVTFKSAFERIDELLKVAEKQETKIHQAFASKNPILNYGGWSVYVVGPTEELFRDIWLNDDVVKYWFNSDLYIEDNKGGGVIDDPSVDTQPVNNSSIILLIEGYGRKYLFTGDAGKRAIRSAMSIKDLSNLNWFDVPHHGSRRNIDSEIIEKLSPSVAYVSSPGTVKHPRKTVIKALQKKGVNVYSTCKNGNMYHNLNNSRDGFVTAEPWPIL